MLLDLGLAFQIGGSALTKDSINVPGTLYYIAPEMLEPGFRENLDYRADLYTTGLTLYEFATGANPFVRRGDVEFTTLYRIKKESISPLQQHRTDLPKEFCDMVDKLLKKIPALRPANISMMLKQLERI